MSPQKDGIDTVGDHCQELYHKTLKLYLANACNHIMRKVGLFVKYWAPQDLEIHSIRVHADLSSSSVVRFLKATVELFVPSLSIRSIAASLDWFREFIAVGLAAVHGCSIAEYNSAISNKRLLESSTIVP